MKGYGRVLVGLMGILLVAGAGCDRFKPANKAEPLPATAETTAAGSASYTVTPPKVSEDQVIARVNDRVITVQDFKGNVTEFQQLFGVEWKTLPDADKERLRGQLLDGLVGMELMARDSVARGALRDPEVQAALGYMIRGFLARHWRQREQSTLRVTQEEIAALYAQRKELFKKPGSLHVRQLAVRTEAEAKQLLKQLLDGADFAGLAKTSSVAPNASSGGDLGWVVRAYDQELYNSSGRQLEGVTLFPAAEGSVFALDVGGISQIVKGPGVGGAPEAFYLFQVAEKQLPKEVPLADVQEDIRNALIQEKVDKKVGDMKNGARVETHIDRVKAIKE